MQIHNPASQVRFSVDYGNDFQFTGDDKKNGMFYEPLVIRGRQGGSYMQRSELGQIVWDRVSQLCYNEDTYGDGTIEQLAGIHAIQGDKNDYAKTYHIKTGVTENRDLFLGLESVEDQSPKRIKKLELVVSHTREEAQGILVVSERQFSQFLNLALAIQAFSLNGDYERIKPR